MVKLSIFLVLLSYWAIVNSGTRCGIVEPNYLNNNRIVGGGEAQPHEYPWIAYIQSVYVSTIPGDTRELIDSCDGSLIEDQWIVSAAHCFSTPNGFKSQQVMVALGAHNLANKAETRLILKPEHVCSLIYFLFALKVIYIIRNVHFRDGVVASKYDISMIKLPQRLDLGNEHYHITPICLPHVGEQISKTDCQSIGWGKISAYGSSSNALKYVTHPIIHVDEC